MKPDGHPPIPAPKVGVLVINLGTPDAPEAGAVKRYLKEFLSDRRVVEIPPLLWQPILRGVILNTRPKQSAHAYAQVWGEDGSPLAAITAAQAKGVAQRLGPQIDVRWAMRYGNPAIGTTLAAMKEAGCERILIAPLYPQYCAATTATAIDAVAAQLASMRWQPAIRTLPAYYDDKSYIAALADDVERQVTALPFVPQLLLMSFHGMPQRTLELGDPYHCHCRKTARLLEESLAHRLPGIRFATSFQSRFGRAKWLEPATDKVLNEETAQGTRRIAIVAPGFSADCLETREELAIRGRDDFIAAGGEALAVLDCLNTSEAGMAMLEGLVRRELAGWL